jgi:hypothetical protein
MLVGSLVCNASEPGAAPLAAWAPAKAPLCLEILQPGPLLEPLLSPAFAERLRSTPALSQWQASRQFQDLQGLVRFLEASLQTNWQSVARSLLHERALVAIEGPNRLLLAVQGNDAALLNRLHDFVRQIAVSEAEKQGQAGRVRSTETDGVTQWTFDGREAHALLGARFLFGSQSDVLGAAVALRDGRGDSLSGRPAYQAARAAVGSRAAAWLYTDLEQLRAAPGFLRALDEPRQNPLGALLLAGGGERLKTAPWLALGLYAERGELAIRAFVGGTNAAAAARGFASPPSGAAGAAAPLEVPGKVAVLSVYRDLAAFYGAKDDLFPQRTSGLIFFENMMGIFFSGRNLTDEVLAQTQPQVRLVVARQRYDPAIGTPEPQWPAFAAVFALRDPKAFGEVVEEAWQKALGLVNFTRGQKALPGLIIDRVDHRGTRITVSRFSAKDATDRQHLDQRFNFGPSLALVGGHAILSSTEQLARELVDALAQPAPAPASPAPGTHTWLELSGVELATLLKDNRPSLVRGNMLKEGHTQPQAEAAIDTLCGLVGLLDRASLRAGGGGQEAVELRVGFSQP